MVGYQNWAINALVKCLCLTKWGDRKVVLKILPWLHDRRLHRHPGIYELFSSTRSAAPQENPGPSKNRAATLWYPLSLYESLQLRELCPSQFPCVCLMPLDIPWCPFLPGWLLPCSSPIRSPPRLRPVRFSLAGPMPEVTSAFSLLYTSVHSVRR